MSTFKIICPECQCTLETDEAWEGILLPWQKCNKKLSVKNPDKEKYLPAAEAKMVAEKIAAVVFPRKRVNQVEPHPEAFVCGELYMDSG